MKKRAQLVAMAILTVAVLPRLGQAQEHPVGGLRIADETGAPVGQIQAPPGEKHFHLDSGVQKMYIAFDFNSQTPTEVQVRLMGPMGAILFQHADTYDTPGTKIVEFDNGFPLEDNEYVVNAYVGSEGYLADSLQLAIGAARIPPPVVDQQGGPTAEVSQATMVAQVPAGADQVGTSPAEVPGGPPRGMLLLAGVGVLVLMGVVVWAARSALGQS